MDREKFLNTLMFPADWALKKGIDALEAAHVLGPAANAIYVGLQKVISAQLKFRNDLDVAGIENVPKSGGIILASNHQSWLDVSVLGATCPRKVHFIAKSEFQNWPVLRHMVRLGESVFIKRGGDNAVLESIAEALKKGWAVAIYPEGTIPGEEEVPRSAIDPNTGLLPGHTGVVRLALMAGVPIIPVGVSGTGRALPPEVYPRLELLRLPAPTPIRIRFGEPISLDKWRDTEMTKDSLRAMTNMVMSKISELVDHLSNFPRINVPIPEPPKQDQIGVLLLHGFTSHISAVDGLVPYLKEADIPYSAPILRGHGTRYEDLNGVTARHWYIDAERALIDLWSQVDQVVVVGFSMGGLVALELAMRHPAKVAGVVSVATALKFKDPMARFAHRLSAVAKYWDSPNPFNDESAKAASKNYPKFPLETFASLYDYSREIVERLGEVHVPIRILQSKKDQVVAPVSANIIHAGVSSPNRELIWYSKSGHEMMADMEKELVFKDIMDFAKSFRKERA